VVLLPCSPEADRYGRSMRRFGGTLRTLATVVLVLVINLVLDVAFDLAMLVRWAVALFVVLLLTVAIPVVRRRVAVQGPDSNRT
jgi:hypothetical protein